jgi:hypothetical protein
MSCSTKTNWKKSLVSYFKNNGITTLKKHVDVDHGLIVKKIKEELNNNVESPLERWLAKKRHIMNASAISKNFGAIDPYIKICDIIFFTKPL